MNLLSDYKSIRKRSEDLCAPLEIEDYVPQSALFASPPKWNLAHTSWFFEEFILKTFLPKYKQYHPIFSFLFNIYYEGSGKRTSRNERGSLSRPTVKEVYDYRAYVDRHMIQLLSNKISKELSELIFLGLNHEQQHQELFYTDHKFTLSRNPLYPVYSDSPLAEQGEMPVQEWISIKDGLYDIGHSNNGFSFDNECPSPKVFLNPYKISNRLVSNGEYKDFIKHGGYENHEYWHEEGWKWVNDNDISHPIYWQEIEKEWHQYTLAGMRRIQNNHILTHVNYYEAFAYAQWKGLRLPTEFEWEVAASRFSWGDRWEWTESAYLPYPGFKKPKGTVGEYNGKFMVNQKVLRGASLATASGHSRSSYRNFFHPQFNWQFNGIRLAK
ncbi:MAG: ergothioneine biosynthesis protein EgtB [Bacteroidales bacterium]|jgi:ergothioneine biosynthesis protein EgtB|nr:ergothioneine biosynthesis protein EgtB [Bacteroidales bacterium]